MKITAQVCPVCGDRVYSRARHDCRSCLCGNMYVDGGFDYTRIGAKDIENVTEEVINVKATKKELYDDWYKGKDKYGIIPKEVKGE